jgi:hypothetical protein
MLVRCRFENTKKGPPNCVYTVARATGICATGRQLLVVELVVGGLQVAS